MEAKGVSAEKLGEWEKALENANFLGGDLPSGADNEAFEQIGAANAPDVATYPNLFAWFCLVMKFHENVRKTWAGAKGPQKPGKKQDQPKQPEKAAPKKADDDDDVDLFGDDDEDDEAAKKALEEQKKKNQSKKKVVIAKSLIIFDVKVWDSDTNLDDLAKEILKIEMDGLFWKTEYKKEPVAFGVYKLCIGCVIEDDKISSDDLQEKIEALEDYVQSVDISCFSKI